MCGGEGVREGCEVEGTGMGTGNGGRTVLEFEEEVHLGGRLGRGWWWVVGVGCSWS